MRISVMAGSDTVELRIKLSDTYWYDVDVQDLEKAIHDDGEYAFLRLYSDGELLVSDASGSIKAYQAREPGSGTRNSYWGDFPGGYEFVGTKPHNINPKTVKTLPSDRLRRK